jgi:serine/threonine protein kinase
MLVNSSFIVNMKTAFQDRENLYLIMDLLQGGDLRFHFCKNRKFTEEQTSNTRIRLLEFFIACILLSLEYLHRNSIIHRDIKPENLVFDRDGTYFILIKVTFD